MHARLVVSFGLCVLPALVRAQPPLNPDDPTDPDSPVPVAIRPEEAPRAPIGVVSPPPPAPIVPATYEYEHYASPWDAPRFATGAFLFLGSYGMSIGVAVGAENDTIDRGTDNLYIPVVGPWIALADRPDCANAPCDHESAKKVLLVADGVIQAGGVITMISGLVTPREQIVRRRVTSKTVHLSPGAAGHVGVSLSGRF